MPASSATVAKPSPFAPGQKFEYLPKVFNGGFAGIVGVTCVFPIDLVKTRLQNQRVSPDGQAQYQGIRDCARKIWQSGGVSTFQKVRSLYAGSGVNILLITPEKAIKLVANDFFRHKLSKPGEKKLSAGRGMVAGGLAGLCQIIITTPMELLKIQMQQASAIANVEKSSATALALRLLREKGIAGLYRGIRPTIARDVTFSVLYFPLFAKIDSLGPRKSDGSGDAVFYASFLAGIAAGGFSSLCVTPLDVIKTRIQLIDKASAEAPYKGIADAFVRILRNEGPRALFKGAICRMLVMAPLFGIAQMVYFVGVAEKILGIQKLKNVILRRVQTPCAQRFEQRAMEALAEHDFTAKEADELTFKRGQVLKILNKDEDPHWFKAEYNGVEGLIPSNYIRMMEHSWYMGNITRNDAESLLMKPGNPDGAFLVRISESTPGEFSISVRYDSAVQHFKVLRDTKVGQYYLWSKRFNSLNELINYHRANSVSKSHTILLRSMDSAFSKSTVQALFDFTPQEDGELAFKRGDVITVTNRDDDNWWEGKLNNRIGMFPATYVCPYNSEPP